MARHRAGGRDGRGPDRAGPHHDAALLRFARNPARLFTIIAAVVFAVTLIPDFTYIPTVPGVTGGQTAILVVMHSVAAGVIVSMLTTLARPQAR